MAEGAPADNGPVRPGEELDWAKLLTWLRPRLAEALPEVAAQSLEVRQFPHGSANLTYLLRLGSHEFVLRRPPFGEVAPGAHDMKREFKVLSRLWRSYDRAPRAFLFGADPDVIGAPFFIMERRHGVVVRDALPPEISGHPDVGRRISFALVDAMTELHTLEPGDCELADLGKPAGFVDRQLSGWARRWELVRPDPGSSHHAAIPPMEEFHRRLARSMPAPSRVSVVHNDLKLDNCQFTPSDPDRVTSIFDWDMTTLGDPLVDLGTLLNYWPDPSDPEDAQRGTRPELARIGLPGRAEIIERYRARTGANLAAVRWWEALALWKTVVVVQQLHRRWVRGESTDPRMATIADRTPSLIAAARIALDEANF